LFDDGSPAVGQHETIFLRVDVARSVDTEPHDRRATEVSASDICESGSGQVQAISDELNAIGLNLPADAGVRRKGERLPVPKRLDVGADLNRHRGAIRPPDSKYFHRLKIGAAIAGGRDTPISKMPFDVRRRQTETPTENGAPLKLIRRNVREPFLQI
jgi:hypothetical protein